MCVFFFQAEDGIRDLVRSRGLGDVYKRQGLPDREVESAIPPTPSDPSLGINPNAGAHRETKPVSYTHLTLPTSDLV